MGIYTLYEMDLGFPMGSLKDINPAEFPEANFTKVNPLSGTTIAGDKDTPPVRAQDWQVGVKRKGDWRTEEKYKDYPEREMYKMPGFAGVPKQPLGNITAIQFPIAEEKPSKEELVRIKGTINNIYRKHQDKLHPNFKEDPRAAYEELGDVGKTRAVLEHKFKGLLTEEQAKLDPIKYESQRFYAAADQIGQIRKLTNAGQYTNIFAGFGPYAQQRMQEAWGIVDETVQQSALKETYSDEERKKIQEENWGEVFIPSKYVPDRELFASVGNKMLGGMLSREWWSMLGGGLAQLYLAGPTLVGLGLKGAYKGGKGLYGIAAEQAKKGVRPAYDPKTKGIFKRFKEGGYPIGKGTGQTWTHFINKGHGSRNLWNKVSDKFWSLNNSPNPTHNLLFNNFVGYTAGYVGGDIAYSLANEAWRMHRGYGRSEKDVPAWMRALNAASEGAMYGLAGHYIGSLFRAVPWALRRALFVGDPSKLKRITEMAHKFGISPGLVVATDRTYVSKFPTVLGKFPIIGRPFVHQAERTYPEIASQSRKLFNYLAPIGHMDRMSGSVEKMVLTNANNIFKLSESSLKSFYNKATRLDNDALKEFIPTRHVKALAERVQRQIDTLPDSLGLKSEYGASGKIAIESNPFTNMILNLGKRGPKMNVTEYVSIKEQLHNLAKSKLPDSQMDVLQGILINMETDFGSLSKEYLKGHARLVFGKDSSLANFTFTEGKEVLKGLPAVEAAMTDLYKTGALASRLHGNAMEKYFLSSQSAAYKKAYNYSSTMDLVAQKVDLHPGDYTKYFMKTFLNSPTQGSVRAARLLLGNNKEGAEMMQRLLSQKINTALESSFVTKGVLQKESIRRASAFEAEKVTGDVVKDAISQAQSQALKKQLKNSVPVGDPELRVFDVDGFIQKMGLNTKEGKVAFQQWLVDSRTTQLGVSKTGKMIGERQLRRDVLEEAVKDIDKLKLGKMKGVGGERVTIGRYFRDVEDFFEVVRRVNNVSVEDASKFIQRRAVFSGAQSIGTGVFVGSQLAGTGIGAPILFFLASRGFSKLITDPAKLQHWNRMMNYDDRTMKELWKSQTFRNQTSNLLSIWTPQGESQREKWEATLENIKKNKLYNVDTLLDAERMLIEGVSLKPEPDEDIDAIGKRLLDEGVEGRHASYMDTATGIVLREQDLRAPGPEVIAPGRFKPKTTPMGETREILQEEPQAPPVLRGATGRSSIAPGTYSALFPQDTLGAGISQQRQRAQGPQRTSLMASGGIALATPATGLIGKVFENPAARNIMNTFWGTPMQGTVQNLLLEGTALEGEPRPKGQVKLSTQYDPQGKWTGTGPEPKGVSTPEGQEAWFTPPEGRTYSEMRDPIGGQWRGPGGGPSPMGSGWSQRHDKPYYMGPGKVTYESMSPITTSASAILQQDPSKYRVAGFNEGGILSTRSAKQMVA